MPAVQTFISQSPLPCLVMSDAMELIAASSAVYDLFDLPSGVLTPGTLDALAEAMDKTGDLADLLTIHSMKLNNPGSCSEFEWVLPEAAFLVKIFTFSGEEDSLFFGVYFEDISAKKHERRSLEEARRFLEQIINTLPLGIIVFNDRNLVSVINECQMNICNRLGQEVNLLNVIGEHITRIFPDVPDVDWTKVEEYLNQTEEVRCTFDGEFAGAYGPVFLEFRLHSFAQENGRQRGAVLICDDVTEKRSLEAEVKEAEQKNTQLKTLQNLNVTLKHEIYNVLTPVSMNAELLKFSLMEEQAEEKAMAEAILEQVTRLQTFIDKLSSTHEIKTTSYINNDDEQMFDLGD